AALATQAQTVAQGEVNPQNKVAMYKTAALAAWQAGPALGASLKDIIDQGEAACNALPAGQPRPTHRAMIRMAPPFAIADSFHYADNNSTPTMSSNPSETQYYLSISTVW